MAQVIEVTLKRAPDTYDQSAWVERDNFPTASQARGYASFLARQYPATPYRIVKVRGNQHMPTRWAVMYVPEWKLWQDNV